MSDPEQDSESEASAQPLSTLELLLESSAQRGPEPGVLSLVGVCMDAHHPTLLGRVCVRWTDANGEHQRWLPTLHKLAVRERDHLLLLTPANADGPIVIGVVDGFAKRPQPPPEPKQTVTLQPDESIRVISADGTELVTVVPGESGPEIRLLHADADVRLSGKLRLRAKSVAIEAEEGGVDIEANHDVTVRGEIVHLN